MPDRKPLPPPFDVGTRLRYLGRFTPYIPNPDGLVRVTEAAEGYMAFGGPVDGYSIYHVVPSGGNLPTRRVIWPANAGEWEVISTDAASTL